MQEQVPTVWTITIVFLLFIMGLSIGVFGMVAVGASTGAQVGNFYGARLTTLARGDTAAAWFSSALSGRDMTRADVDEWQTAGSGRAVQNNYQGTSGTSFSWLLPGVRLRYRASGAGRIEKYFAGPPVHGYE